jgi:YD repeat-containing protein
MPPRWNDYRKVIQRNGFVRERSAKHETWLKYDKDGAVIAQTRASHGNAEIPDRGLFKRLLKQCGKTEEHFAEVLRGKRK